MKRIKIDRDKCISCLTCISACIVAHDGEDSRNRVVVSSDKKSSPIFCRHCDLPECVYTCMTGAMSKNPDTGYVCYNKEVCASCYMCVMACPYGVLKPDRIEHQLIMKCDMCQHLESGPYCVAKCPTNAIILEDVEGFENLTDDSEGGQ